jgi:glutaminyl-tRNA synthetase
LNPASRRIVHGFVEPSVAACAAETRLQFERHGYFVSDRVDHRADHLVFNRITGLKDGYK